MRLARGGYLIGTHFITSSCAHAGSPNLPGPPAPAPRPTERCPPRSMAGSGPQRYSLQATPRLHGHSRGTVSTPCEPQPGLACQKPRGHVPCDSSENEPGQTLRGT